VGFVCMYMFRGGREVHAVVCYSVDVVANHGQLADIFPGVGPLPSHGKWEFP
jgi:hypothetical protein